MNAQDNWPDEGPEVGPASTSEETCGGTSAERNGGLLLALAPEDRPDVSQLITEDGAAVDSIYVEKQYRLLTDSLESSWPGPGEGCPFVALTNVGLFFADQNPPLVPDFLLSLGVSYPPELRKKEHHSYFAWRFGKPPDVVGEIVSDRRGGEDTLKLNTYARQGIRYYWVFDPDNLLRGGNLRVFALHPEGYLPVPDNKLSAVGLGLTLWTGNCAGAEAEWLRWCDQEGRLLLTGRERAEEREERIKRLEEQLRQLGAEPSA
jgi:Uma2 family endonuclease